MHYNFHHIFRIHRIRKELKEVYANRVIDRFANCLLNIFIPIYLITIGFDLWSALLFLVVANLVTFSLSVPSAFISSKVGLKHTILYRAPILIAFTYLLSSLPSLHLSTAGVVLAGMILGIAQALYWIPFNSEFVKNSDKIHEGEEVGILLALPMLAATIAPAVGGLVLNFFGFTVLFTVFAVIVMASVVPLFATRDYNRLFQIRRKEFVWRLNHTFHVGFMIDGIIYIAEFYLWPLYIFLTLNDPVTVGVSVSLTIVGLAVFNLLTGKFADMANKERMMKVGAVGYFFVWVSRVFVHTHLEFFLLSFLGGMFCTLLKIPLFARFCEFSKERKHILNDVALREMWIRIGMTLVAVIPMFGMGITSAFVITGMLVLLYLFLKLD